MPGVDHGSKKDGICRSQDNPPKTKAASDVRYAMPCNTILTNDNNSSGSNNIQKRRDGGCCPRAQPDLIERKGEGGGEAVAVLNWFRHRSQRLFVDAAARYAEHTHNMR